MIQGPSSSESSSDTSSSEDNFNRSTSHSSRNTKNSKKEKQNERYQKRHGLRPIPPQEYNGKADLRAYYRFLTEGTSYVIDGNVKAHRQVYTLSYYLTDKAYDYYTQKVALNNDQWTLTSVF